MGKAATPKRMCAYVRVSRVMGREGESYISPGVQEEAVRAWATSRGVEIIAVDKDEDESGGTQNRPALRKAIKRIEDGESDGIAVHKLNRFARNVAGGIEDIRKIQDAGGTVAFVEEGIDPTGPFGDFLLTVLLAVAELELSSVKQGWEVAKTRAVERGVKIGPTPFGYVRNESSRLEPHPVYGPIVTEAYKRAAAGDIRAALTYLEQHAEGQRRWDTMTVRRMLEKDVYLGHVIYGEMVMRDAHEALTTPAIWELANRHEATPRAPKATYPMSGYATCAGCGSHMVGASTGTPKGNIRTYRCPNYRKTCDAPAMVTSDNLEQHLLVAAMAAGVMVPGSYAPGVTPDETTEVDAAELAAVELRAAREALESFTADADLQRVLGSDRYIAMVKQRQTALEAAEAAYEEASGQDAAKVEEVAVLWPLEQIVLAAINGDVPQDAPLSIAMRAAKLVTVQKGRGSLGDRVTIEWGDFPKDPRPGEPLSAIG